MLHPSTLIFQWFKHYSFNQYSHFVVLSSDWFASYLLYLFSLIAAGNEDSDLFQKIADSGQNYLDVSRGWWFLLQTFFLHQESQFYSYCNNATWLFSSSETFKVTFTSLSSFCIEIGQLEKIQEQEQDDHKEYFIARRMDLRADCTAEISFCKYYFKYMDDLLLHCVLISIRDIPIFQFIAMRSIWIICNCLKHSCSSFAEKYYA